VHRSTEPKSQTRFRSERFFRSDAQWYFNTRERGEGGVEGPYPSREAAQLALTEYLLELGLKPADVWALAGDHR
jgi:Domain of unknown function (DUF6316)